MDLVDDKAMNALFDQEAKGNLVRPVCMRWAGVLQ
jgi:hypothetical protein